MNRETLIDAMPREWTTYAIRQHLADALLPVIAAALDEAEARGRAEVAAKVEALASALERDARTDRETVLWVTREFRLALVAEVKEIR